MISGRLWSFHELRETGLLWLINTTVFHPRGYAIGLNYPVHDESGPVGEPDGFYIMGDGSEPWVFSEHQPGELDKLMRRAASLLQPDFRKSMEDDRDWFTAGDWPDPDE